ncbi:putative signal transducing protein [Variovorax sp. ZT4R33]|uniref:putative signal transducing protein n=1 Tax=Variovorax sp. ZT4R33 TaxID=3443743 RepID=UPI003F45EF62
MRRLAQAPNLAIATLWVHALLEEGIAASVQREFLGAAVGQLPPDQCLPEIWVEDDAQFSQAQAALRDLQHRPQRRWHCGCGELVEGGFEQCWQCGAMMPAA